MSWKRAASMAMLFLARCGAFWVLPLGVRLQLAADGLLPSGDVQRRSLRVVRARWFQTPRETILRVAFYGLRGVLGGQKTTCMHARLLPGRLPLALGFCHLAKPHFAKLSLLIAHFEHS